jgi:hypothetical protein
VPFAQQTSISPPGSNANRIAAADLWHNSPWRGSARAMKRVHEGDHVVDMITLRPQIHRITHFCRNLIIASNHKRGWAFFLFGPDNDGVSTGEIQDNFIQKFNVLLWFNHILTYCGRSISTPVGNVDSVNFV